MKIQANSSLIRSLKIHYRAGLTTIFMPVIYIIVLAVGLPTNTMAIYVLLFRSKKINPAAIYMGNLALADLMFVIWTPLKIAYHLKGNNWTFGEGMCKVLVGFFYGNMYCSILFITCLSIQRYWVCAHPLTQQRKNNKFAIIVSMCIWIFIWSVLHLCTCTSKRWTLGPQHHHLPRRQSCQHGEL